MYVIEIALSMFVFSSVAEGQNYTLVSNSISGGLFCPGEAIFLCNGSSVPFTFEWFINGSSVGLYVSRVTSTDVFPLAFPFLPETFVTGKILNVTRFTALIIDIESELKGNVSDLVGTTVYCGFDPTFSDQILVQEYGKC